MDGDDRESEREQPESILPQWVVYDHPRDFPDKWVVRRWVIQGAAISCDREVYLFDSLDEARVHVLAAHPGAYQLDRQSDDDPSIFEVWL